VAGAAGTLEGSPAAAGYRLPAEWEPSEAVWLARPRDEAIWPGCLEKAQTEWENFAARLRESVETRELGALGIRTAGSAIRDFGPVFLVHAQRGVAALAAGPASETEASQESDADRAVPAEIARRAGIPILDRHAPLRAGSFDTDGLGTLLVAESRLAAGGRDPVRERGVLESRLRETFGVAQIVELPGEIEGEGRGGHLDDVARFVAPGLVAAVESPPGHPDHARLAANRDRLRRATDARGQRLEIVPLPSPTPIHHEFPAGGRRMLPASHANFLMANNRILVPVFGSRSDDLACRRLEESAGMPAVAVMARSLVVGLGGLHRLSCQQPAGPAKG
jgi:agmatine deiminase